jgi:hypothetical protein
LEHFLESKKLWFGILGKKKIGIEQTLIVVFDKNKIKNSNAKKRNTFAYTEYTLKCLP